MVFLDLVLVIFLGVFIIYGFYLGLIRMVLGLISAILAIIVSLNIYLYVSSFLSFVSFISDTWIKIISFILVLSITSYLLNIIFKVIGKILRLISSLPVISFVNRIAGGFLGLIQGLFILGIIIYVSSHYALSNEFLKSLMIESDLAPILVKGRFLVGPMVPDALKC
jgi:uncharacterized membrane protein required for colicin V production